MTELAVLVAFRAAVASLTGLEETRVTIETRGQPRLNVDHVELRPVTRGRVGLAYRDGEAWSQHRRVKVQLMARGGTASDGLLDAHVLMQVRTPAMLTLRKAGVGVVGVSDIRDLTRQRGQALERTSLFDVELAYVHTVEAASGPEADRLLIEVQREGVDDEPVLVFEDIADQRTTPFLPLLLKPNPILN